jgi:hypothetical protein
MPVPSCGRNPADIVASIIGPFFYRRWFSREPIDDKFVRSVVASLVARLKPKR